MIMTYKFILSTIIKEKLVKRYLKYLISTFSYNQQRREGFKCDFDVILPKFLYLRCDLVKFTFN